MFKNKIQIKIIITSATLNYRELISYFSGILCYYQLGKRFSLEIFYNELNKKLSLNLIFNAVISIYLLEEYGGILIFLAGIGEIQVLYNVLKYIFTKTFSGYLKICLLKVFF